MKVTKELNEKGIDWNQRQKKLRRLHFLFQTEDESQRLTATDRSSVFWFGEIKKPGPRIWGKEGNPPLQNIFYL